MLSIPDSWSSDRKEAAHNQFCLDEQLLQQREDRVVRTQFVTFVFPPSSMLMAAPLVCQVNWSKLVHSAQVLLVAGKSPTVLNEAKEHMSHLGRKSHFTPRYCHYKWLSIRFFHLLGMRQNYNRGISVFCVRFLFLFVLDLFFEKSFIMYQFTTLSVT